MDLSSRLMNPRDEMRVKSDSTIDFMHPVPLTTISCSSSDDFDLVFKVDGVQASDLLVEG